MSTRTNTKKGYYTVEAAIFLPVFIIAIMTIAYLIKVVAASEEIMHAATDEARYAASHAYVVKTGLGFSSSLENRIRSENEDVSHVHVSGLKYLYTGKGKDGLISFNVDSRVDIRLPLHLFDGFDLEESILCRGWIGKTNTWKPLGFDEMEKNGDSRIVWIFPRSGEKYHKKGCTFVSNTPSQFLLSRSLKKKHGPCSKCQAKDLPTGSIVYCYERYGEVYHRGSCRAVDKYVKEIQEEDAKAKGYLPCSKCGG
ncbi:MAG: hypothetical protein ACOYJU_00095 [Anaerovoracaceae bacterium]|jgi:hypothetical protein